MVAFRSPARYALSTDSSRPIPKPDQHLHREQGDERRAGREVEPASANAPPPSDQRRAGAPSLDQRRRRSAPARMNPAEWVKNVRPIVALSTP